MTENTYNYREQILSIFLDLDQAVCNLFHMGFNIGLEEEWQDLKEAILGPDAIPVPMDLEYLQAINHPAIAGIIEMIKILAEARNSLENINLLTEDELSSPQQLLEDNKETEGLKEEINRSNYLDHWIEGLYMDFMILFEGIWELEHQAKFPEKMYDAFNEMYFEGTQPFECSDQNTSLVLDALQRAMAVNRLTEFYVIKKEFDGNDPI